MPSSRLLRSDLIPLPCWKAKRPRAGTGTAADPLRTHGGLRVHLLPRRGTADGARPRRHAELRDRRPGLRRCPPGNFGMFASPERRLVFDINDFDETLPGPWEWDVKRLATSLEIAGAGQRLLRQGSTPHRRGRGLAAYRKAMRMFAAMPALEVWYAHAEATEVQARLRNELDKCPPAATSSARMAKARTKDNLGAMNRFAGMPDGQPADHRRPAADRAARDLLDDQTQREEVEQGLRDIIAAYRATLEPERRVAARPVPADRLRPQGGRRGQSSGTRSWMALLLGDNEQDPLFLQAKEAGPSVLEAVHQAQRVRQLRPAGRRRAAAHAGGQRHLPRLGPGEGHRRSAAGLLLAPAPGLEGFGRDRDDGAVRDADLRRVVRLDARPRPRAIRGPRRHRGLPRLESGLRRRRSASSPRPTPTRTSGTTRR